ncbi:MAG: hypothetical protein KGJ06_05965 [Pseudomonadota bacterium]|nr:hypothetical protein [Pseudomonadota bacterium]
MSNALAVFGQRLIHESALPVLTQGYGGLVRELAENRELARLAREKGPDAALAGLAHMRKGNKELVTRAEKDAEQRMADAVRKTYPAHAIVGEEHGWQPGSQTRWVFDPVDGTSAMIRSAMAEAFGLTLPSPAPSFGITVGVVDGEEPVLGIVTELQPQGGRLAAVNTWVGIQGQPTTQNGRPVSLPPVPALAKARIACTVPEVMFNTREKWSGWQALAQAVAEIVTDQNAIGFMKLLTGQINIAYEADLAYHDAAALAPILRDAGITVSNAEGQALRFPENAIGSEFRVLAAQPALHAQAMALIRAGVPPEENRFTSADSVHKGYAQKFPPHP